MYIYVCIQACLALCKACTDLVCVEVELALNCSDDLLHILDFVDTLVHTGARGAVPPGKVPQLRKAAATAAAETSAAMAAAAHQGV